MKTPPLKLYVSRHVYLEHIPFFSLPASSHYLNTSNVLKTDHFDIDDTTPTFVPTLVPFLAQITNTIPKVDTNTGMEKHMY